MPKNLFFYLWPQSWDHVDPIPLLVHKKDVYTCITVIQRGILKHEYKNCANQELQTYCFGNRIYNKSWKTIVLFSQFRYKSIDDSDLSLLIGSFTVQSLRYIT